MSKLEMIRHLYEYNEWANDRLLSAASGLPEAELVRSQGASFGSIVGNLAHVAAAQINWLERWRAGKAERPRVDVESEMTSLAAVRQALADSHGELGAFLGALTDERLNGVLAYRTSDGQAFERPLWQLMTHVANHGTYHRGEVAMALSALGRSPGDIDFIFWEFDHKA